MDRSVDSSAGVTLAVPDLRFGCVPFLWVTSGVTLSQLKVAVILWGHRNRKTGQCNPSQQRIADETGMGRAQVCRAIKGLQERGLLTIRHTGRAAAYELRVVPDVPQKRAPYALKSRVNEAQLSLPIVTPRCDSTGAAAVLAVDGRTDHRTDKVNIKGCNACTGVTPHARAREAIYAFLR